MLMINVNNFKTLLNYAKEAAESKKDIVVSKLADAILEHITAMENSDAQILDLDLCKETFFQGYNKSLVGEERKNMVKFDKDNFLILAEAYLPADAALEDEPAFDDVSVDDSESPFEEEENTEDSAENTEKDEEESIKNIFIRHIDRTNSDEHVGHVPVVFLGTLDRAFGAGIGKYYADKYPKLKDAASGTNDRYLSVYREKDILEQNECILANIGKEKNDIMFCVLTPKINRYSIMDEEEFKISLESLFELMKLNGIKEIAMPKIGSEREGMDWKNTELLISMTARKYGIGIFFEVKYDYLNNISLTTED